MEEVLGGSFSQDLVASVVRLVVVIVWRKVYNPGLFGWLGRQRIDKG